MFCNRRFIGFFCSGRACSTFFSLIFLFLVSSVPVADVYGARQAKIDGVSPVLARRTGKGTKESKMVGKKAPVFILQQFNTDKKVSLNKILDGRTMVIISFFDTKCEPCIKELPHLKNIHTKYSKYAKVFLVGLDEKPEEALTEHVKKHNVTIPILLDPLGYRCAERYRVSMYGRAEIPQVFVIGKDGIIKKHLKGFHQNIETVLTQAILKWKDEKVVKPEKSSVSIVYTNSTNGYLESCGCPENPFGGLVRRMTAIKNIRKQNKEIILVDSGDLFPPRPNKLLSEYCVQMMKLMKYDAVAIGDQELLSRVSFLKKYLSLLPFYSANMQICTEEFCSSLTEAHLIKQVKNIKIGIVSIINPDVFILFPKDKISDVKILDHKEYLKQAVPELRKDVDILILLSHCGDSEDKKIATEIFGIDVIVGGHSQTFHKEPVKIGNTIIVQAGENGHRVGKLDLFLNKIRKIESFKHEFILLNKDIPDDPQGRLLINGYNNTLKKRAHPIK